MKVFCQVHRGAGSLLYMWEDRYMHYLGTLGSVNCTENANLSCGNAITWHCVASENQRQGVKLESKDLVSEGREEWKTQRAVTCDARMYKPLFELVYLGGILYILYGQVFTVTSVR